jgi:hypothetical protein
MHAWRTFSQRTVPLLVALTASTAFARSAAIGDLDGWMVVAAIALSISVYAPLSLILLPLLLWLSGGRWSRRSRDQKLWTLFGLVTVAYAFTLLSMLLADSGIALMYWSGVAATVVCQCVLIALTAPPKEQRDAR